MRKIVAMIMGTLVAASAMADININWRAQAGFYENGTAGAYPGDGIVFPSGSALAMLIWTPFNGGSPTIDPVDITDIAGNYTGGDDLWLDSLTLTYPGNVTDEFAPFGNQEIYQNVNYGGTTLQGGYVYIRIFSDTTPASGEYYFNGPTLLTTAFVLNEAPQILEGNTDNTNGNQLNQLIVPEPSVLAFLGAGALMVAIRRMRKA